MDFLKEATKFLSDTNCVWDQPSLHRIIAGLVQMIVTERRRHAEDMKEARYDAGIAVAHDRHSRNEFGGQDM